ncbi:NAD(P)-binding protein [Punctularia strigosozonata HHB-11173 SS5]|uniref:NAD(P)-binding protein n=1 Tax=Punctularia strigosozonata (strain HHB-11173) TaxID=741275 RepID=UPI000441825E|nr:NAD(P)-binding protein [Punctularia strigosozonata HHB-11173 SS5]EIN05358.1 NAD(P)-binding protein [Punctularia strigosozonata HHB-11173 SS5]
MSRMTPLRFVREQWATVPEPAPNSARGQTIAITGATSGLGLAAAHLLARLSPTRLILTGRQPVRMRELEKQFATGEDAPSVDWREMDAGSFASVRAFADSLVQGAGELTTLLANAGLATRKYVQTPDKWESTLQVNHLSPALLAVLALPKLARSATPDSPARIFVVSSDAHFQVPPGSLADLLRAPNMLARASDESYCTPSAMKARYALSKLLVTAFIHELAARLPAPTPSSSPAPAPAPILAASLNPGFCHSSLTREAESAFPGKYLLPLFKSLVARSADCGARAVVLPVVAEIPKERNGKGKGGLNGAYVTNGEVVGASGWVEGGSEEERTFRRRVWDETVAVLKDVDPRVEQVLAQYTTAPTDAQ